MSGRPCSQGPEKASRRAEGVLGGLGRPSPCLTAALGLWKVGSLPPSPTGLTVNSPQQQPPSPDQPLSGQTLQQTIRHSQHHFPGIQLKGRVSYKQSPLYPSGGGAQPGFWHLTVRLRPLSSFLKLQLGRRHGPWPPSCCHSSVRVCFVKGLAPSLHSHPPLFPAHTVLACGRCSSWFHSGFTAAAYCTDPESHRALAGSPVSAQTPPR